MSTTVIDSITNELLESYANANPDSNPECRILLLERFVDFIKEGKIPGFKFESKGEYESVIHHDKEKMSFFAANKNIYDGHKHIVMNVENYEKYDYKVENLEKINDIKNRIISKPFYFLTEIEATRDTYKQKNVHVKTTCNKLVVCVYPNAPHVKKSIDEAFAYAEDHMKNGKKFSLYLNFEIMCWDWYKEYLLKVTGDKFYISSAFIPTAMFELATKTKGLFGALKSSDSYNFVVKEAKIELVKTAEAIVPKSS